MATKSDVSMSTCIDSYGSAIGMPQLCTDWASNQIFWLVVTLVAIFFVLSRLALPRISAVLSERQGTITNDLAAAENLKQKQNKQKKHIRSSEDARLEASKIIESAKAEINKSLMLLLKRLTQIFLSRLLPVKKQLLKLEKMLLLTLSRLRKTSHLNWLRSLVARWTPKL